MQWRCLIRTACVCAAVLVFSLIKWRSFFKFRQDQFEATKCAGPFAYWDFRSQSGEDRTVLHRLACNTRKGTFVEIGALDGVSYSNTYWLESNLGWSGLLIEAQPDNAQRLKQNRPRARIIDQAVCDDGVGFLQFIGQGGPVSAAVNTMSEKYKSVWHPDRAEKTYSVPCRPIGSMIKEAGLNRIDYFSLDVEGAELAVLQTMSWEIPVCMWTIELDGTNATKDAAVRTLLFRHGYIEDSAINWANYVFKSQDMKACGTRVPSYWRHVGQWLIMVVLGVFLIRAARKQYHTTPESNTTPQPDPSRYGRPLD